MGSQIVGYKLVTDQTAHKAKLDIQTNAIIERTINWRKIKSNQ